MNVDDVTRQFQRVAPAWLASSDVPHGWEGTVDEWHDLLADAQAHERTRASYEAAERIAALGFNTHELVSGRLDPGREISLMTRAVVDRRGPAADPALVTRAREALKTARDLGVNLQASISVTLDELSRGFESGRNAKALIAEAERSIAARRAELQAAERERAALIEVDIPYEFSALGRTWPAGQSLMTVERVERLLEWQEKMEAQARRIIGEPDPRRAGIFHGAWPPFGVRPRA
jgi:hypothetical protein